ncbi:Oligoendopeptidase F, plasmid [compost metagenome]
MSQLLEPVSLTWDLDSLFAGGSTGEAFPLFLEQLERDIKALKVTLKGTQAPTSLEETYALDTVIDQLQSVSARVLESSSFTECLTAQDQHDKKAVQLSGKVTSLGAQASNLMTLFHNVLFLTPDDVWQVWMEREEIKSIAFVLTEKRNEAREKLAPELESLASDLAVSGYHAWGQHYDTIVANIAIPSTDEQGNSVSLSVGQAANKLDDGDRDVREATFEQWEKAWKGTSDYSADTLNALAGFRLKLYENRGWDNVLKEPLDINRMSEATLNMMWQVINKHKPLFVKYMDRKAKLLGVDKLSWCDVDAPLGKSTGETTYDYAAKEIVKQFAKFSPKLANFATHAFNQKWIEAEDRNGKRPGGFCTSLPVSKETRIFMTFGGTISNMSTLAHELGHAYHQYLMDGLPMFNQDYAMNVAETASTFAEMIVSDALVENADSKEEKVALLADKVQRSIAFFMNIHARFLFETEFYEQRKQGTLEAEAISALMEKAQREAFHDSLSSYHPYFWSSKLHFYITGVPFYNFPYTFGYMFSTGIYAIAKREGTAFAPKYDALLQDTGCMSVEDLAAKHLGVDLTQPDFWEDAMKLAIHDVEEFLELTQD